MWQKQDDQLYKEFKFDNFKDAFAFMTNVAVVAEKMQHHPRWENEWNKVRIWLSTHDAGDTVTAKDEEFAAAIDKLMGGNNVPVPDQHAPIVTEIKMYGDGGSRGNPGPSAGGF